jgi:hypothetical protein
VTDLPVEVVPAWDLIGHEGTFRLPGGRSTYEAVMYNDATARGSRPRLVRLEARPGGIHQVDRYVDWEQPVEVLRDFTLESEEQHAAERALLEEEWGWIAHAENPPT